MKKIPAISDIYRIVIPGLAVLGGLYAASRYNYLLFHISAELFSIIIGCCIFIVAWNSRRIINNNFLLFLGIAYLFVAVMDMAHMLTYKGMGVVRDGNANIPTQLWISARYIESLSLLAASFLLTKRISSRMVFAIYGVLTSLVFISIFYWKVFPDSFIEGSGLTPFKIYSEYIISFILLSSVFLFFRKRRALDQAVFKLLTASIGTSILSELSFTFYVDVYGFFNLAGHFLKIISFFLIYKAIIEKGLMDPYSLLFRDLKLSIEAQEQAEQKYQDLADMSLAGIFVSDIDGSLLFVNDTLARMLGYGSPEEMSHLTTASVYKYPGQRGPLVEKLKSKGRVENTELELLTRSGGTVHAIVNAQLRENTVSGVVIDITRRKEVERSLFSELEVNEVISRLAHALILPELALDNISHMILESAKKLTGSEHGYVATIDPVTKELVCRTFTSMAGSDCKVSTENNKIVFPPAPDGSYPRLWGHSLNIKEGSYTNDPLNHEAYVGIPDGHIPLKNFLSVPAITGENTVGQIALANSESGYTDRDLEVITRLGNLYSIALQRRQMEDELDSHRKHLMELVEERTLELKRSYENLETEFAGRKQAEKQTKLLALFTELNPSPVLRFDMRGNVIMANAAAEAILNIDKTPGHFTGNLLPGTKDLDITDIIRNGRILSITEKIGNNYYHFTIKGIPEHEIGHIYGSDISEQKKTEAEMIRTSQLALMGELAAGVAHEINNPINGIINYTQILANRNSAGTEEHEIAERIIKESMRISGIVKDLLFFTNQNRQEKRPVRIHEVLSDALKLLHTQIKKDSIILTVSGTGELPEITACYQQIEQVFLNIISNARYALNQRYPGADNNKELAIHAETVSVDNRPFIRVKFLDRGTGIPNDILDKLTESFFSTKPVGEGTGLGLNISSNIISDHGGSLSIRSTEGEFTEVTVELPAGAMPADTNSAATKDALPTTAEGKTS